MAAILVVDDESSARTTLALLLRKRGHRVTDADGVRAAVKALAEEALQRENANLRAQVRDRYGLPGLIAGSPPMVQVLELVRRVAPTDATVLIQGESGTGKEVIAKAIHHASDRARGPFVA